LGYVVFPHHKLIRTKTKKRIFRKLKYKKIEYKNNKITKYTYDQSLQSYLGVLSHANTHKLSIKLKNIYYL